MGRLPLPALQGRRRGRAHQPQHQAADPLLPGARGRRPRAAARPVRPRRRDLRRARRPAGRLEFEVLQERIHPAASRVDRLAEKTPAGYVAFDLLALDDDVVPGAAVRRASRRARSRRSPGCLPTVRAISPAPAPTPRRGAVVPRVRGRRTGRRDRQADGCAVRRERPHHAEDQARADRRRRRGGHARAQDEHARAAAARQPAPRPVRRRRSCSTSESAPASPRHAGPSCGRRCRSWWCRSRSTPGANGRSS